MFVSIIIPTYNRASSIARAVESALNQTYPGKEVVVVDDGSTDNTRDVLGQFRSRIKLVQQANRGPSAARNVGIKASAGEIIAFLDSDDDWMPEKIERQVSLLQKTAGCGVQCCVTNARIVGGQNHDVTSFALAGLHPTIDEGIWINPLEMLITRFLLFNQVVAVRREALEKVGYFNEGMRILEDYDLALRLATMGPWAFLVEPMVIYHAGTDGSLSSSVKELDALVRSQAILSAFASDPRWAKVLPAKLIEYRQGFLGRRITAHHAVQSTSQFNAFRGKCLLWKSRLENSLNNRFSSTHKMVFRAVA